MKTFILGISGSPRKDGNTDIVVKEALKELGAKKPGETKFIQITDFKVEHCRGCRECMTLGHCAIQEDEFMKIWEEILWADVIILGAPVYWNSPPGVIKNFIDRTHGFYIKPGLLSGKKAGIITVATAGGFDPCEDALASWLRHYGVNIVAKIRIYAREKGEVLQKPDEFKKVHSLVETICAV